MHETEKYIRSLLQQQGFENPDRFHAAFMEYVSGIENQNNVKTIRLLQETMKKNWQLIARREELKSLQIALPNGSVGKPYKAQFDLISYGLEDITAFHLTGFEGTGLKYNLESRDITGIPQTSGDIALDFTYNFEGEPDEAEPNCKKITIIINPDPKSLWKDIPSDENDQFAKADNVTETALMLGANLLVSSKRGRSHANKGGFREDDYAFSELESGWGIIAISDGAGSAKHSRKGSAIACASVINYLREHFTKINTKVLDAAVNAYQNDTSIKYKLHTIASPYLLAAAQKAYLDINFYAQAIEAPVSDFHATLAFVLLKKYSCGYAFLSFSVGDCPMALVGRQFEWVKPLNWLDTGEFGGGTRFITMPEILNGEAADSRVNFEFVDDLPYLVLMSDGVYDPKFEVEANLAKPEQWKIFFEDLQGENDEGVGLNFAGSTGDLKVKLSQWMDFWSPGNHDDRTLAILF
jgi:serine/threonine protein phosphatase PrpC